MNEVNRKHVAWYTLSLLAIWYACFSHVLDHPLDLDDHEYIQDSAAASRHVSSFFSPDKNFGGRPVTEVVLWIGYIFFGADSSGLHGFSLLFHYMASLLLAYTCLRMGMEEHVSFLTGLLFLVNVAHFHAVFWISAVAYPLSMCFSALAIISYCSYEQKASQRHIIGIYAFSALGVLAHIAAAFVWPFCLLLAWFSDQRYRVKPLILLGPLLVSIVVGLAKSYPNVAQVDQAAHVPQLIDTVYNMLWYWSRLVSTAHWLISPLYDMATWELFLGGLVVALLAFAAWYGQWRPVSWIILSTLPFATMSTTFLQTIPSGPSRYLYFSSAGAAMLFAWLICRTAASIRQKHRRHVVLGISASILTICSAYQLRVAEGSSFYTSACNYSVLGKSEESIYWFQKAIDESPLVVPLENAYDRMGLIVLQFPNKYSTVLNRGLYYFPKSVELNIFRLVVTSVNGLADQKLKASGKLNELKKVEDAAELIGQSYFNLALGFSDSEQWAQVEFCLEQSQQFLPDRRQTLSKLVGVYTIQKRYDQAINTLERMVSLGMADATILYPLGLLYRMQGNSGQAESVFNRLLNWYPDSLEAKKIAAGRRQN